MIKLNVKIEQGNNYIYRVEMYGEVGEPGQIQAMFGEVGNTLEETFRKLGLMLDEYLKVHYREKK